MSKTFKKAVDSSIGPKKTGLSRAASNIRGGGRNIAQATRSEDYLTKPGIGGTFIKEAVPNYIKTDTEEFISNKNNAHIVLGRDRPGHRLSGYGGLGHTQCASIDIVTGHLASHAAEVDGNGEKLLADPNFDLDAARIYLSQKSDIDEYFGLATIEDRQDDLTPYGWKTKPVLPSVSRASVGVKADTVRIIGRENIRLVTGKPINSSLDPMAMPVQSMETYEAALNRQPTYSMHNPLVELASGGEVAPGGIDLVARNEPEGLQPIPRGKNLEDCLWDLFLRVEDLQAVVMNFVVAQIDFNASVMSHRHISPFHGAEGPPSHNLTGETLKSLSDEFTHVLLACRSVRESCIKNKGEFLRPSVLPGVGEDRYINSLYNRTN